MERSRSRNKQQIFLDISVDENIGPHIKSSDKQKQDKLTEGVQLNEQEQQYLLPHFMMMLVGKPGSGKTSVIKQLLNEQAFYYQKFDYVLLVSPSATKMDIKVKKENMTQVFSLKWIEDRLFEINKKQKERIVKRLRELQLIDKVEIDRLHGQLGDSVVNEVNKRDPTQSQGNILQDKERFFSTNFFKQESVRQQSMKAPPGKKIGKKGSESQQMDLAQYVDELHQKFVKKLPNAERNKLYCNCLIVLDDMVSQIKAAEFDPLLTQLIFNRRHLIMNGMVSLIVVSQKYTMIPARVRSNANWLVLFRLNPVDFDNVFKDVIMMPQNEWTQLIDYIFGGVEKKYNNLGIWVEQDDFFLNFNKLNIFKGREVISSAVDFINNHL